ncbi:MAG: LysR family transcriptional regulator [Mameliella sp.]|nr:LysR family transcriptional regulator [Phaeodactylibacter sp.]
MNLQFVKYFIVLAEVGSFTHAAAKVHVVQSTFSTGIKKLEQQLNCKLFYRDNRQVFLTDEGKQLLPKAKALLRTWSEMESVFSEDYSRPLRLGVVSEIDFNAIVPMMKTFHELYPNIETQIIEKTEAELHQLLKSESIDAYFLKYVPFDHNDFSYRQIRKDRLVFAVPQNHAFATKSKVSFHAIDGEDLIERTNCSLYDQVEGRLKDRGINPKIVFRAKGDDMAKALVASGLGISIVPEIDMPYPILPSYQLPMSSLTARFS